MISIAFCQRGDQLYLSSAVGTSAFLPFSFLQAVQLQCICDVVVHSFTVLLQFDELISPVDALEVQFIMHFDAYCEIP